MNALAFFHSEAVARLLERAARGAGTPLALHFVERKEEGIRIVSWGRCEACRYVAECAGGKRACRQSRVEAASRALRQERPLAFVCHMGFACVAAPALANQGFVLTFGPYCPAEESRSLEFDARNGLLRLTDEEVEGFPVPLDDIHRAPVAAAPAVAEWTLEALAALWDQAQQPFEGPPESKDTTGDARPVRKRKAARLPESHEAADMAVALVGGNQPQARALLRGMLEEVRGGRGRRIAVRRARMIAAVAEVIEALEGADADTRSAWDAFHTFVDAARGARTDQDLLDAAMGLLGIVKREAAGERAGTKRPVGKQRKAEQNRDCTKRASPRATRDCPCFAAPSKAAYRELNRILSEELEEGITLAKAARRLGETPSAISHRRKRKFGMSYSEYVGRLRVDKAKELLRRTRLTATEIARRVGIRDQSNFSKTFKRFEGLSPLEYRKRFGRRTQP